MADNVSMPADYQRGRDLAIEANEQIARNLSAAVTLLPSAARESIKSVLESLEFYRQRCNEIHRECLNFCEADKQTVIEVLACGKARHGHRQ
jgi:hypothetical protein